MGEETPKSSTQERFILQPYPGVRHAMLPVWGESGDGKQEKPPLHPAECRVPPTFPDAHLPQQQLAATHHAVPCRWMPWPLPCRQVQAAPASGPSKQGLC